MAAPAVLDAAKSVDQQPKHVSLREGLRRLGFAQDNQIKLYGQEFDLVSDPIVVGDNLVLVDAIDRKSGRMRRVRIPLPIVKIANGERIAA